MGDRKENSKGIFSVNGMFWIVTAVLVAVGGYFLLRGFLGNPLAGKWQYDENDLVLNIEESEGASVKWKNFRDGKELNVSFSYTLVKEDKKIRFNASPSQLAEAASEIDLKESEVSDAVRFLMTDFDYNLDRGVLVLTDTDYGEQCTFDRVR